MSEWKQISLGNLVESISKRHAFNKDRLIFLNTSDIFNGKVLNNEYTDINTLPGQAKKSIQKNDILFSEIRPANRRFAYIDFESEDYVVSTKLMVLRPKNNDILPKYLYYFLTSEESLRHLQEVAESRSGTFPQITFSEVKEMVINLPPLKEQQRIVEVIDSLTEKIELNLKINETLEEMAMTLYKHWFVDFGPFQDGEFVESELGMIPKGWSICELEEIVEKINERVKAGEHLFSLPYVPIDVLNQKSLMINGYKHGSEAKSSLVKFYKGDILFGAMRPYFHKVCIAPFDGITRTTCFVLRPKNNDYYAFVVATIFREETIDYANSHSKGSTIPYADWETLSKMKVILPPLQYLKEYNEKVVPLFKLMIQNFLNNEELVKTRDYLLPRLLSGEIDVSKAEKQVEEVL
ncbi:restriction endonuclease subunit S [Anoxybacillus geothermalis]|nr:restriction endonuclease subunit S [Anoxybacillus geothermalis]